MLPMTRASRYSTEETRILEALDAALRQPRVRPVLEAIAARVEQKLASDAEATLAWEPVSLEIYGALPAGIRSSWVFVLRAGTTSGPERHPNSHQRMMSYRGRGDMQLWANDAWQTNALVSHPAAPADARWVSIPVSVWHKPVMAAETWVVVSFHTAPADELIEERGDPALPAETKQHTYSSMAGEEKRGSR
jgi:hypothetical protein